MHQLIFLCSPLHLRFLIGYSSEYSELHRYCSMLFYVSLVRCGESWYPLLCYCALVKAVRHTSMRLWCSHDVCEMWESVMFSPIVLLLCSGVPVSSSWYNLRNKPNFRFSFEVKEHMCWHSLALLLRKVRIFLLFIRFLVYILWRSYVIIAVYIFFCFLFIFYSWHLHRIRLSRSWNNEPNIIEQNQTIDPHRYYYSPLGPTSCDKIFSAYKKLRTVMYPKKTFLFYQTWPLYP